MTYCKKTILYGYPSTLHLWWDRHPYFGVVDKNNNTCYKKISPLSLREQGARRFCAASAF